MLVNNITELIEKNHPELIRIRRQLHQNPELSFKEYNTTNFIADYLEKLGFEVLRPLETGCLAVIEGSTNSKRVIALRADIDALPIEEEGDYKQSFKSQTPGVAHCCGHDIHTTNLLGTAKILSELKGHIDGKIILIFQAGEEKLPGGGRLLSETGILQKLGVQTVYGLHTDPRFKPGQIALKEGPLMARPDEFELKILGKGGHAAAPHTTVDPIVLAAQVVGAIQTIVSRSVDPTDPAVVTIGKIEGGSAHNVISSKVTMLGTIRTFDKKISELISERIESIASGITKSAGGDYEFFYNKGYPAVINTLDTTQNVIETAEQFPNTEVIELNKPVMAGEDFAFYQQHFPGTFFFLGSGSEETESIYSWHHPKYNADEESMKTGVSVMVGLALNLNKTS
ncbi:MAG: amidohydrolase [Balneolales bacterium]